MYISHLTLKNFRTFQDETTIQFHEGTNVIIGHNNAGKTTIIKALELLFDSKKSKRLSIDDFNKNITCEELKQSPPKITISAILVESEKEETYSDDLVTVSTWLTKLDKPYEAKITYEFFLPDKELENYHSDMKKVEGTEISDYWNEIKNNYLRKYVNKIYVGNTENRNLLDTDSINKFAFQFLTAIRDVERDLFTGSNTLLKEVIDFFIDYEIKTDKSIKDTEKKEKIREKKKLFSKDAQSLILSLQDRMKEGKKHMLQYVEETGAAFDKMQPSFEGTILDTELYTALKLIVENETGIKLPAVNNGLGYNNLVYISLLLSKMQKDASGEYLGSNAKVYSILAIEEPEAHLHPNMQYKFLKFLKQNRETQVRQIFITSHSPNITAAVDLEDIIVLYKSEGKTEVAYPGKVFDESPEDIKSRKYVQRFIDVTKADIFFAKNLILVEGLAEQLIVPEFASALGHDLTDTHTSVINIGGRYFEHFLKLFDTNKNPSAIKKKVACITDLDPLRKEKNCKGATWKTCPVLALYNDKEHYDYNACSNSLVNTYKNNSNNLIRAYSQKINESCTFEYDLILHNITCEALITDSTTNKDELENLMTAYNENQSIDNMLNYIRNGKYKEALKEDVQKSVMSNDSKKKHIIADRYLKSITKGELAQELAQVVSTPKPTDQENHQHKNIVCPPYIREAITWICQPQ
ncbi:ATP-dependent nuclease [Bacillus wiedmannii]|uniref:ATP-dependent nuclease n=1 Tax=Bacillus wiedmannii TaxID=1890302 RepID=UPI000BF46EBF|nr:AAA family ATPase [Bacillus wiedmannii]MDM5264829.1 AAA family ATPase [Bacillus wiedmannii]PFZ86154.1 ATP-dependent endonuclease [Bacillus wiedmannii]